MESRGGVIYVFTRSHKLSRVQHQEGDELECTQRMGDWLISQGVPLKLKDGERVERPAKVTAPAATTPAPRPAFVSSPRFKCCGWK